jgi:hypothetical protein
MKDDTFEYHIALIPEPQEVAPDAGVFHPGMELVSILSAAPMAAVMTFST